ncbi:hypothetical protein BU17DRAFT_88116 [Hysterangium stoloniferum]|nr:hypothetical protein BU17DRAFT_88116 [Hysterangium stoloniferum]
MAISVELLESPTERQIKQAIAVALAAFEGDICIKNMTGGNETLRELLFRSMVGAGAVEGSFTVRDGADNIVSTGIWFKPGRMMMDSVLQRYISGSARLVDERDTTRHLLPAWALM